jgi:hypothetical protein
VQVSGSAVARAAPAPKAAEQGGPTVPLLFGKGDLVKSTQLLEPVLVGLCAPYQQRKGSPEARRSRPARPLAAMHPDHECHPSTPELSTFPRRLLVHPDQLLGSLYLEDGIPIHIQALELFSVLTHRAGGATL